LFSFWSWALAKDPAPPLGGRARFFLSSSDFPHEPHTPLYPAGCITGMPPPAFFPATTGFFRPPPGLWPCFGGGPCGALLFFFAPCPPRRAPRSLAADRRAAFYAVAASYPIFFFRGTQFFPPCPFFTWDRPVFLARGRGVFVLGAFFALPVWFPGAVCVCSMLAPSIPLS